MLWTGYLAVVSWLVSLQQWVLVSIWIGAILGLESGRRSEYPTVMIMLCGVVLGSLFCIGIRDDSFHQFFDGDGPACP